MVKLIDDADGTPGVGTDNTEFLQSLVDAENKIVLSPGTYRFAGRVELPEGCTIFGNGANFIVDPDESYPSLLYCAGSNISVSGIHFIGNGLETPCNSQYEGAAVGGFESSTVSVKDCTFDRFKFPDHDESVIGFRNYRGVVISCNRFLQGNSGGKDINVSNRTGDVVIIDNLSYSDCDAFAYIATVFMDTYPDSEIYRSSHNVITGNVHVKNKAEQTNGRHGIIVHYNGGISHSTIANNILVNGKRHGIYLRGTSTWNTGDGETGPDIVQGNVVRFFGGLSESETGDSVSSYGYNSGIKTESIRGSIIQGNLIEDIGYNTDGTQRSWLCAGIDCVRPSKDTQIKNNLISRVYGQGICLCPTVPGSAPEIKYELLNIQVEGNTVSGTFNAGIHLIGRNDPRCRAINVRRNTVYLNNDDQYGIVVQSSTNSGNACVEQNTVIGSGKDQGQFGISHRVTNQSEGATVRITGNDLFELAVGVGAGAVNQDGTKSGDGFAYVKHRQTGTEIQIDDNCFDGCDYGVQSKTLEDGILSCIGSGNRFVNGTRLPNRGTNGSNTTVIGSVIGYDSDGMALLQLSLTSPPISQQYYAGDRVVDVSFRPENGGWVCTESGSPGVWEQMFQDGAILQPGKPHGVITPTYVGQEYFDETLKDWYKSTGLTDQDWKAI